MEILLNDIPEKLQRFSRVAHGIRFTNSLSEKDKAVALVIEGPNYESDLAQAIATDIPVVVIAGLGDQKLIQLTREYGIPDGCIVIKKDESIETLDNKQYGRSARGISVLTITEICAAAHSQKAYPVLNVWEEAKQQQAPNEMVLPNEPVTEPRIKILQKSLSELLNSSRQIIAVIKTVGDSPTGKISAELNRKLEGLHVEIGKAPSSFKYYEQTFEQAILSGQYTFFRNKQVDVVESREPLILEVDTDHIDGESMELICNRAHHIVHVPTTLHDCKNHLDNWINPGFKLSAIIPDEKSFRPFKEAYGRKVTNVQGFISLLKQEQAV